MDPLDFALSTLEMLEALAIAIATRHLFAISETTSSIETALFAAMCLLSVLVRHTLRDVQSFIPVFYQVGLLSQSSPTAQMTHEVIMWPVRPHTPFSSS